MSRLARTLLGLAVLILPVGCGDGAHASPEGSVQSWLDALSEGDSARMREAFTPATRELVDELERLSREAEAASGQPALTIEEWCTAFCGAAVESSTLHGDSATVTIRVENDVNDIRVVRGEDGWRIDLSKRLEPAVQMLRLAVRQDAPAVAPPASGGPGDTAPARPDETTP